MLTISADILYVLKFADIYHTKCYQHPLTSKQTTVKINVPTDMSNEWLLFCAMELIVEHL